MSGEIGEAFVRIRPNMASFEAETLAGVKHTFRRAAEVAGVAYGAAAVFELGKHAVEDAAQVQKSQEVVRAQFGKSGDAISKFAETAGIKLGIASHESESVAARFGILFHNMGLGQAQSAEMTLNLEKLAGSLSAIRGIDPAAVMDRLPIALAGNIRGLKTLGISIDAQLIKQTALKLGFGQVTDAAGKNTIAENTLAIAKARLTEALQKYGAGTTQVASAQSTLIKAQDKMNAGVKETLSALSPAQRAQVIYAIATKNLGEYQAQAAAHAGDFVNVQRRLSAEWDKAKETLGTALLPILSKYSGELARWLDRMDKSGRLQSEVNQIVRTAVGIFQAVAAAVKIAYGAFQILSDMVGGAKHAIELFFAVMATAKIVAFARSITQTLVGVALKSIGVAAGEEATLYVAAFGTMETATLGLRTVIMGLLGPIGLVTAGLAAWYVGNKYSIPTPGPTGGTITTSAQLAALKKSDPHLYANLIAQDPGLVAQLRAATAPGGADRHGAAASRGPATFSPSQITQTLLRAGATPAEAAYLTAISGREDASGNVSALNDSTKTHDYSVGLFQINFRDMANRWMRGGKAAAARLSGDPLAQAKYALGILHSQGPGAWSTNTPALQALLGGSTGGGGGGGGNLVVGTAPPHVAAMTKAQLAAARQTLENGYKAIATQASKLGSDMTTRIKVDMAKARAEIGNVSDRATVATARQKLTDLRAEVTARLTELRTRIALTNTFDGLKTQVAKLGTDVTPQIAAQMKKIQGEIGNVATPQQIANVRLQMTQVKNEIAKQLAAIKKLVDAEKVDFDTAWGRLASGADNAFQKATNKAIAAMKVSVTGAFGPFDFGGSITQTPSEIALAQLQAQHQATADAKSFADAQNAVLQAQSRVDALTPTDAAIAKADAAVNDLTARLAVEQDKLTSMQADPAKYTANQVALQAAAIQTLQSNLQSATQTMTDLVNPDPATQSQAATDLLNAQTALADAQYNVKVQGLTAQASAESAAAQKQLSDAQSAYQDQRTLLQQQMDDRVAAIQEGMLNGTIAAADGMAQLTAVLGDPQYGIDMQNSGLVIAGGLFKGLSDGLKPVFALLEKLLDDMRKAGLLPGGGGGGGGGGGLDLSTIDPGIATVIRQSSPIANTPDQIARILVDQKATQAAILAELERQTALAAANAGVNVTVNGNGGGNAAAAAAIR